MTNGSNLTARFSRTPRGINRPAAGAYQSACGGTCLSSFYELHTKSCQRAQPVLLVGTIAIATMAAAAWTECKAQDTANIQLRPSRRRAECSGIRRARRRRKAE